jgi:hypothetical protein
MARQLGLDTIVSQSLQAIVPRVFSDAKTTVGFAEHGDDYERVRYELAKAITRRSAGQK